MRAFIYSFPDSINSLSVSSLILLIVLFSFESFILMTAAATTFLFLHQKVNYSHWWVLLLPGCSASLSEVSFWWYIEIWDVLDRNGLGQSRQFRNVIPYLRREEEYEERFRVVECQQPEWWVRQYLCWGLWWLHWLLSSTKQRKRSWNLKSGNERFFLLGQGQRRFLLNPKLCWKILHQRVV